MLILVVKVRLLLLLLSAKEVPEIFCLENKNTHKLTVKMQLHVALEEKNGNKIPEIGKLSSQFVNLQYRKFEGR